MLPCTPRVSGWACDCCSLWEREQKLQVEFRWLNSWRRIPAPSQDADRRHRGQSQDKEGVPQDGIHTLVERLQRKLLVKVQQLLKLQKSGRELQMGLCPSLTVVLVS